jgi:hypothetical protein
MAKHNVQFQNELSDDGQEGRASQFAIRYSPLAFRDEAHLGLSALSSRSLTSRMNITVRKQLLSGEERKANSGTSQLIPREAAHHA